MRDTVETKGMLRSEIERLRAERDELLAACKLFTQGAHDAVRALNDAGLPCPASIALSAEKTRAAIAKAEGRDETPHKL